LAEFRWIRSRLGWIWLGKIWIVRAESLLRDAVGAVEADYPSQHADEQRASARYTGGCLCGALRYEAVGEPLGSGHCYCADCRKASGSGFVPFMGFRASEVRFSGEAREFRSKAAGGGDAVRNRGATCMSLVFGGEIGKSDSFTLYAGSLDDPSAFHPTFAIFAAGRPSWAVIPPGFEVFDRMPP
jgi:hypothetical protein